MKKNKQAALNLLSQLMEQAEKQDLEYKKKQIAKNKGQKAVGKSSLIFHLNLLKELLESEE